MQDEFEQEPRIADATAEKVWIDPRRDWLTHSEEVVNTLTHGFGFLLSLVGAVTMAFWVLKDGDPWRVLGCLIYAPSLAAVYAMSTLSHAALAADLRKFFRMLDQGFIYLLIVATYTPFSLVYLRTGFWWAFLAVMWSVALFGFFSKTVLAHRVEAVSIWLYVVLGWMPIVAGSSLAGVLPDAALWWMLIGGLFYTFGTVFLMLDSHVRHFHGMWHLAVIAGSACHFFVILVYVA